MSNTNAIRAGRAFVELFADDTQLVRGLRRAAMKLKAFGASISRMGRMMVGLGAALATPLVASVKAFSSMGDSVAKMAKRTGFSTEALSEFGFSAQQSGASIEDVEKGVRRMQRTITDASMGMKTAQDALGLLGLSYQQLEKLSPEQQFEMIADRLSKIKDPSQKAAIAMMLFGRSGTALLPMMEKGAAGMKELREEAKRLGLSIGGKDAAAAEELNDALGRVVQTAKMTIFQIGAALAPAMIKLSGIVKDVIVRFNAWISQNRQVIVILAKGVTGILAGGIALMALGGIISGLGTVLGGLAGVIVFVGTVFKTLGAAIMFMTQPIVLVIAAVIALGATIVSATGAGAAALSWLGSKFALLKDDALAAYQGIGDALAAGDIALAARILWLTLKMEWTRGVNFLEKIWMNFSNGFIRLAYDAFYGALAACTYARYGMEIGWSETVAFLKQIWNGLSSFFAKVSAKMMTVALKTAVKIKKYFDDSYDLEGATKKIDDLETNTIDKINEDQKNQMKSIEERRKSTHDSAGQEKDAALEEIAKGYWDKNKKLDDEQKKKMKDNADELEKARQEWRESLKEAKGKRTEKDRLDRMKKPGGVKKLEWSNLGSQFDSAADKLSAAGGFSGLSRFGAEGGTAADRTATAAEQIARNTKEMLSLQREDEAV